MVGFSEANNIEKELKEEDDKWPAQLKSFQDSLQLQIDKMSKEYNGYHTKILFFSIIKEKYFKQGKRKNHRYLFL